jgi:hypothetical protein
MFSFLKRILAPVSNHRVPRRPTQVLSFLPPPQTHAGDPVHPVFRYKGKITTPPEPTNTIDGRMRAESVKEACELIGELHKVPVEEWDTITIWKGEGSEVVYYNDGFNKPRVKLDRKPDAPVIGPVPAPKKADVVGPPPGQGTYKPVVSLPPVPVLDQSKLPEKDPSFIRNGFGKKYTIHKA